MTSPALIPSVKSFKTSLLPYDFLMPIIEMKESGIGSGFSEYEVTASDDASGDVVDPNWTPLK